MTRIDLQTLLTRDAHADIIIRAKNEQLSALATRCDDLLAALQQYGAHGDGCDAWPQFNGHFTSASHVGRCTCGLDAALAVQSPATGRESVADSGPTVPAPEE